jgi:hypothetical protein
MNAQLNDVVLHLDEALDDEMLVQLEHEIRRHDGVISAGHAPGRNHLLAVVFNNTVTKSGDILQRVREGGLHAQLVGM